MSSTANEKRLIYAEDLFAPVDFTVLRMGRSGGGKTMAMYENLFRKRVEMAPTVDAVEVVHGRWEIEWEYERNRITGECDESPVATCPFCGHKEWGFAYDDYWGKPYNYCPNCGAKMDGGNEDV